MFEKKYIVLEGDDPRDHKFSLKSSRVASMEIKEMKLSKVEYHELILEPKVRAVAPAMPLTLFEPTKTENVEVTSLKAVTWGIRAIKANNSKYDGKGITVAVLDTGIDVSHPAFADIKIEQKNFTEESEGDNDGHGTHCAGTIFGQDVCEKRIGIARNIDKALIAKVLGEGGGSSLTLVNALNWAIQEGANIVSMSLGIDFPGYVDWLVNEKDVDIKPATSIALEDYRANINLFTEFSRFVESLSSFGQGTIIIAASGNESERPKYEIAVAPPAASKGIVSVGALRDGKKGLAVAKFSNYNVDIVAPGVNIESAWIGGQFTSCDGTSMATPHVAGVAALWGQYIIEELGEFDVDRVRRKLLESGSMEHLTQNAKKTDVGSGLVTAPQ